MPKKASISSHLFTYLLSALLALLKWGVTRTWHMASFWNKERKKPRADRQKIDRYKAVMGLLAIGVSLGVAAWYLLGIVGAMAVMVVPRQTLLYIGIGLVIVGLNIARLMPNRRKLGLLLAAVGALLCAYGLGYLGA